MLQWHPRDVDTAVRMLMDDEKRELEQAAQIAQNDRFTKMQQQLAQKMGRR